MENLPYLSSSPLSSLSSSSPNSKSYTATKTRLFTLNICESFLNPPASRLSATPKKTRSHLISKEIIRLEQELDQEEIQLFSLAHKSLDYEKAREKELKVYQRFIEGVIHSLGQIDTKISKCLNRGWVSYQKVVFKSLKKSPQLKSTSTNTVNEMTDAEAQVEEERKEIEEDTELYIKLLSSFIERLDNMNNEKLIKTLKQLLIEMKPAEVPDISHNEIIQPYKQPIVEVIEIERSEQRTRERENTEKKLNSTMKLSIGKEVQTGLTANDISSWDYLKVVIREKEQNISKLNEKLEKLQDVERNLLETTKHLDSHKQVVKDIIKSGCKHCKDKLKKLEADKVEIKELKQTLTKTEGLENELKKTKSKLKDSIVIIGKSQEKIQSLTENLDELTQKIEEIRIQRERLEAKLTQEENLRAAIESQLTQEVQHNNYLKTTLIEKKEIPSLTQKILVHQNQSIKEAFYEQQTARSNVRKQSYERNRIEKSEKRVKPENSIGKTDYSAEKTEFFDHRTRLDSQHSSFTPDSQDFSSYSSASPVKSLGIIKESQSPAGINKKSLRAFRHMHKGTTIMSVLNMTKDEYLGLSKKVRLELFEVLYEHKEKCGTDCEHLRRAMLIRFREKGTAYPTKKYDIVKT